ncbi:hypothetical protein Angca_001344, partial [Angiostrongylus cantonensis]
VRRIDELEANLHDEQEERTKSNTALVAYMSRCHELEKKIRNISTSYSNLSFSALGKDEVLKLVRKIRDLLLSLGKENKELRKECAKHLGLGELSQTTVDSNDVNGGLEKSALLKENFEQKVCFHVNAFVEVVEKHVSLHEATWANDDPNYERISADVAFIDAENPSANIVSLPRDSVACHNLSALGSGSDEMRHLAGRIRSMKFEWNNVIDESRVFLSVIEVELICCHDSKQMEMLLSTKEEEIVRLQSLVEKIHDDHEKVIASGDNLRDEVKQLEEALFDARKERDGLAATLESKEVEMRLLRASLESEELKRALLERETEAKEIRAVLEEEQERGKTDREEWKIALMAAQVLSFTGSVVIHNFLTCLQETSSALRSDVERILNELSVKEDTIRHLNDQLQTAKENNLLMAEVVSEYASNESLDKHICKSHRPTVMANVQNLPQISTVKSRDSQTELTRAALVKMESDFLSHTSEIDMLRLAYDELSHAIGKLVVKDVEPLPNPVYVNFSIFCSFIVPFEDNIWRMQFCIVDDLFDNPMRQTLFVLTTTAMDLVKLLRRLSSLHSTGHKVNFQDAIELARKLRNELNERFLIVRTEKENENKHCVTDLIHMVKILEKDNRILHDNIKTWRSEYEALSEKIANNPELVERIANQLRRIHTVMGESRRACGLLQESQARTNKPATEP